MWKATQSVTSSDATFTTQYQCCSGQALHLCDATESHLCSLKVPLGSLVHHAGTLSSVCWCPFYLDEQMRPHISTEVMQCVLVIFKYALMYCYSRTEERHLGDSEETLHMQRPAWAQRCPGC